MVGSHSNGKRRHPCAPCPSAGAHLENPGAPHKLATTTSQEVSPRQEAICLTLIRLSRKKDACSSVPLARSELSESELTETVFVNLLTVTLPGKIGRNLGTKAGKLGEGGLYESPLDSTMIGQSKF